MVRVVDQMLDTAAVETLLAYLQQDDDRTDHRPDVRTKHPIWDQTAWPQHVIKPCLDSLLPGGYQVEEVTLIDTTIPFKLHVDSGDGSHRIHKAVLFPLRVNPQAQTVFFDHHWPGAKIKFSRDPVGQFHYRLTNRHGHAVDVPDIRDLLRDLAQHRDWPDTPEFRAMLEDLIAKRQGQALSPVPDSQSDYSQLTNMGDQPMDPDLRQRYLQHLSPQTLHGLRVSDVVEWQVGSAIEFDRTQLHCASHCHSRKIFVTIFTLLPDPPVPASDVTKRH